MDGTIRVRSMVWFATGVVVTLFATVLVMQTWRVDAAPGDTDSTFVAIDPCRLIDTRQPGQTMFTAKETRTLAAHGTNGDCTIPSDAVGVSMNMTALDATTVTFVTVWPGGTFPTASSLNPAPGQPPTPNAVTTTLSDSGSFNVYNDAGTIGLIIDINGYYTNSTLKELAAGLVAANAKIVALDAAKPFSVTNYEEDIVNLTVSAKSYLDVSLTAPVDGQVAVNYSTYINNSTVGGHSGCAPFLSTDIPSSVGIGTRGVGYWKDNTAEGSVSGTASFDISAGATVTYSLVCNDLFGSGQVAGKTMTAIFTPTP